MARRGTRRHGGKERFWRHLLRQWRRSGRTVRDFCAEQAVSVPSFYAWRRTIADRDQQASGTSSPAGEDRAADLPVFVPLRVLATPAGTALELVLAQGRVVRMPAGFDSASLRQLLAILEERPSC